MSLARNEFTWRNAIVRYDASVPIDQLLGHEANPWLHGAKQQEALFAVLDDVGWWDAVKVNVRSGKVVDGHARIRLALRHGQKTVPVLFVSLSDEEERIALLMANQIARMVGVDTGALDQLLAEIEEDLSPLLETFLGDMQRLIGPVAPPPPEPIGLGVLPAPITLLVPPPRGRAVLIDLQAATDDHEQRLHAVVDEAPPVRSPAQLRQELTVLSGHRSAQPLQMVSPVMRFLEDHGYLRPPVLDYGSGMDPHDHARFDPAYTPDYRVFRQAWGTVTLLNVLNIIPLEHNRLEALMTARALRASPDSPVFVSVWQPGSPWSRQHQGYQAHWFQAQWEACLFRVFSRVDTLPVPASVGWWAWRCLA